MCTHTNIFTHSHTYTREYTLELSHTHTFLYPFPLKVWAGRSVGVVLPAVLSNRWEMRGEKKSRLQLADTKSLHPSSSHLFNTDPQINTTILFPLTPFHVLQSAHSSHISLSFLIHLHPSRFLSSFLSFSFTRSLPFVFSPFFRSPFSLLSFQSPPSSPWSSPAVI